MSTLEAGDKLAGDGATGKRVTLEYLKSLVAKEEFINPEYAPTLTIAVLVLVNGFVLVGKSACADPANFNAEKGRTFAKDDALRELWSLEGYRLRSEMYVLANIQD